MRKFCFTFLLLMLTFQLLSSKPLPDSWREQYEVIKDLNREWITLDANNRYVPYIDKSMADVPLLGVLLNLSRFSGSQLLICMPAGSAVLTGKKIASFSQEAACIKLSIDSLARVHEQENLLVSVYQQNRDFEEVGMWIVQERSGGDQLSANQVFKRNDAVLADFFTIGILVLLVLYAILINQYPRIFSNLFSLSRVFSLKVREDNTRVRLINEAHIVFLIQHCLLLGFLFIILVSTTTAMIQIDIPYLDFQQNTFSGYMLLWGQTSLLVFGTIWVKYLIVMIFGALFRLRQLRLMHMLDYMRMSLIYGALLFILIIVVFAGIGYYQSSYFDLLVYLFIALSAIRVIVLYFRLFRSASFRNLYLISYICIAEVIPLLVGLEVLVI
jgi:hypothetical protein